MGGLEALQRLAQIALRHEHVADLVMGDRQIALEPGVARIGTRQTLEDGVRGLEALQRLAQIALRDQHVADPLV